MLKMFEVVRVTYSATGLATELMYEKNSSPLKTQVVRIYGAPVQPSVVVGVPQNILRGTAPTPAANIDFGLVNTNTEVSVEFRKRGG